MITDAGSATYHTSILARSFGVPAVVGLGDATRRIAPGAMVVVDGSHGQVLVEPSVPAIESVTTAGDRQNLCFARHGESLRLIGRRAGGRP